jgi:hypothetical protein
VRPHDECDGTNDERVERKERGGLARVVAVRRDPDEPTGVPSREDAEEQAAERAVRVEDDLPVRPEQRERGDDEVRETDRDELGRRAQGR